MKEMTEISQRANALEFGISKRFILDILSNFQSTAIISYIVDLKEMLYRI